MGLQGVSVGVVMALLGVLGGCQSAASEPAVAGNPGFTGELRPTEIALRAQDLYPAGDQRFVELDPDTRKALRVERVRNAPPNAGGVWTRTSGLESLDGAALDGSGGERARMTTLVRQPGGAVALVSLVARTPSATSTKDALYLFEPALVMTPAELAPGDVWEGTCELRVVDLDDQTHVIRRGTASRRIEHLGIQTLQSAQGPVEALRVRTEFALKMGAIRSVTRSDVWVRPGVGVVGESSARVSSLMGIPVQRARDLRWAEDLAGASRGDQPAER